VTLPPRQPPLPNFQLLNLTPYKRARTPLETSCTLTEPNSNSIWSEKPATSHQSYQTSQFFFFRTTPGNTLANPPVASSEHHISSLATPSFIIHTQTVIINNYASSLTSENGSTVLDTKSTALPKRSSRNSEDKCQAPASPTIIPAMPPRDISVLCSHRRRPFSSLQRRSCQCQSMPVKGLYWDGHRDFNRAFQAWGWMPPIH
jgi:hypothetical protein